MTEKFSHEAAFDIPADGVQRVFTIPDISGLSRTYFVRLTLTDGSGKLVSSNFYWLSTQEDVHDWESSTWFHTPNKAFSDLKALNELPRVQVQLSATSEVKGTDRITHVIVENPGNALAFSVHLKLVKVTRDPVMSRVEVLPVIWQDNYFELLPGEKREITATSGLVASGGGPRLVDVDGWNVAPASVTVQ